MTVEPWQMFYCNNPACGWKTPGHFNWRKDPALNGLLPDTDCPKCGYHDSITDGEDTPAPADIPAVRADIHSGRWYYGLDSGDLT